MHDIFGISDHFWDYLQTFYDAAVILIAVMSYRVAKRRRNGSNGSNGIKRP